MGQFASTAFNGDPYVDLMRALPDKELVWWIQKGIWIAQGFTLCEHIARTYPQLFIHHCGHCNGAGIITCPHCDGHKKVQAHSTGHRVAGKSPVGELMLAMDVKNCAHCGDFAPWDAESEWQDRWMDWESKKAYYDRTFGPLWDEMAEDIKHEGKMDNNRSESEYAVLEEEVLREARLAGPDPAIDGYAGKQKKQMEAMLYRFQGHPYENDDLISNKIIDITKPMLENLENVEHHYAQLPPEMNPEAFPELLIMANSPIARFQHEIRMEALIMNNLEAAVQNKPKPIMFEPTAGTVPCPECDAKPYSYSFMPNIKRIFRTETPFWMRTLNNMSQLGTWRYALPAASRNLPELEAGSAQVQTQQYGEVPRQRAKDEEIDEAIQQSSAPGIWKFTPGEGRRSMLDKYGNEIWGPESNSYMESWGMRPGPISGPMVDGPSSELPQDYGSEDPLSLRPSTSEPNQGPIIGSSASRAKWMFSNMNPAKNLARKVRDLRSLDGAENTEEEEAIINWLKTRDSLASEFKGDVPLPAVAGLSK